jgi:hypothetical protein
MRIDSDGNVGIGTSSPVGLGGATVLQVHDSGTDYAQLRLTNSTSGSTVNQGFELNFSGTDIYINNRENGVMAFYNNGSEAARIDSSRNLLVGTTTTNTHTSSGGTNTGTWINSAGIINVGANSSSTAFFNRQSTDGPIVTLRKNGATIGSIGTASSDLHIDGTASHSGIRFQASSLLPRLNGADTNATIDLGYDDGIDIHRFRDLYLSGTANVANISETVYALTGTALDPANGGIQTKTLAANTTFTDSLSSGESLVLQLEAGASYTVTWPTMQWVTSSGNVAPTLTAKDTLVFWKVSTTLYGAYTGSYV